MADTTITALTTASGIDATQDWLPIDRTSLLTTQKINRNTFLEITGSPVGTTDSQALTNKTIGNTNTVTLKDTLFTLQDDGDTTKQAKFQLSGITTATTRTYTLPNASSTLADIATAQTFTNKTLTSPVITGGSITNSTISVDAISEFTAANGVTIDGLNIKDSKLNTNNSVVTANITDAAVTPAKLLAGSGTSWVWQTWTPTWTNLTVGNATTTYLYTQIGKTVHFRINVTFGNTTSIGGTVSFTPPVTIKTTYSLRQGIGITAIEDAGVASYTGLTRISDAGTTLLQAGVGTTGSTYLGYSNLSSTIPMTWGINDQLMITGTYEAA